MDNCIQEVYATILDRRDHPVEKSYTHYLFEQGIDKILKKVGEESAETIIAAKNGNNEETIGEIADLTYHLLVMMAQQGITPDVEVDGDNGMYELGDLTDAQLAKALEVMQEKLAEKK